MYINGTSNIIGICGEIGSIPKFNHRSHGENFYEMTVNVKRISDKVDSLIVTCPNSVYEYINENCYLGDMVHIDGEIRSFQMDKEDGSKKLCLRIFATSVCIDENATIGFNEVELTGYVCKKPVLRKTPLGRDIADVIIALNRTCGKSDYIPCIAWGRFSKVLSEKESGEKATIRGRFQSRQYHKKLEDGTIEERTAYEVSASYVE